MHFFSFLFNLKKEENGKESLMQTFAFKREKGGTPGSAGSRKAKGSSHLSHFGAVLPQFFKRSCPNLILVDLFSFHALSLIFLISQGLGAGFVTI